MKIFGSSHIAARLFMYLIFLAIQLLLIQISQPKGPNQAIFGLLLFTLNPFVILNAYLGLFDLFVMMYVLLTVYLLQQQKIILASICLVVAILSKTFPLIFLAPFTYYLYKSRKYYQALVFSLITICLTGLIYWSYFQLFGDQFVFKVLEFQLSRNHFSTSIWYIIFRFDPFSGFQIIQVITLILVSITIYLVPYSKSENNLYIAMSIQLIVFILLLRTSYPHYTIWYSVLLFFPMFHWFQEMKYSYLLIVSGGLLLNFSGFLICTIGCFDAPNTPFFLILIQSMIHFSGHLIVLLSLIHYIFRDNSIE